MGFLAAGTRILTNISGLNSTPVPEVAYEIIWWRALVVLVDILACQNPVPLQVFLYPVSYAQQVKNRLE
jgi:hypothetical protein